MNQIQIVHKSNLSRNTLELNPKLSPIPVRDGESTLFIVIDEKKKWHLQTSPENPTRLRIFNIPISRCELVDQVRYETDNLELFVDKGSSQTREKKHADSKWYSITDSGQSLIREIEKIAPSFLPVYIQGETGTGKELIARMIHEQSPQKTGPFVAINCGALPLELAESELFGHRKGAFTGATHARAGAILKADQGTLFLDEVADLPLAIQVKLLRFLEQGEIRAIGSDTYTPVKVRILSATHKPILKLVEDGLFREDLYYRLAPITLSVPPLRERLEDLSLLVSKLLPDGTTISDSALDYLKSYSWPGNVRELKFALIRASLNGNAVLQKSDFDFLFENQKKHDTKYKIPLVPLKTLEFLALKQCLEATGWKRKETAKVLGIARSTLFEMMKRYELTEP